MGAVNNLSNNENPTRSKKSKEDSTPSGSIIIALMLVAVLVSVGGIIFHFLKKRKSNENILKTEKVKELDDVSS